MSRSRILVVLLVITLLVLMVIRGRSRAQVGTVIPTPSPIPSATATPPPATVSRSFHCNCTSAGQPVIWAGNVTATSYFLARQAAVSACSAYLGSKPLSPLIPTPAAATGAAPTFAPLAINACGQCACN